MTPAGVVSILHSFSNYPDGSNPVPGLVQGPGGELYGTTDLSALDADNGLPEGGYGVSGDDTIFSLTTAGTGETILHTFTGGTYTGDGDGSLPNGLILGSDGNFYGTTQVGGPGESGTVFSLTPAGVFKTLYAFGGGNDGGTPSALVEGRSGEFYGTTASNPQSSYPPANQYGTVFSVTSAGVFKTLHTFSGTDGVNPLAGLVLGSNGNLYGTTSAEGGPGSAGQGTVFSITPSGGFTTLAVFDGTNGAAPQASLIQASDGNFYGTATDTIFSITPQGVLTPLYTFTDAAFTQNAGSAPLSALIQAKDGSFYGTAEYGGGGAGLGSVFRLSVSGRWTSPHTCADTDSDPRADTDSDPHAKADPDSHAKADPDSHAKADSDSHAKADSDSHAKADSDSHAKADSDSHAKA